ncbi:efflux RND transporter periplasmic adaptor subunit [Vibrio tapetis]|uniref:Putative HlyD-like secretion protein n=1 Tax=Vibrio tapetis subsp. tapetis TaxID=1671868 RepID=A0A2N8Z8D6_9VIBR|nr:HlyD family secretion protein [Vibrio tapetis]SON48123.1 putative HlyD-like secretion protein [Vibrio tapetis subsp. tapetis]
MTSKRKLLFFPVFAVGVLLLVLAVNLRPTPPTKPAGSRARLVEVMPLELKAMAPIAIGFGKVEPKLEWKAISEVTGKVVYRHPHLEKGRMLPAGTEILRIDPLDYELKLAQTQADLTSSLVQLSKLDLEKSNLESTIKIETNRLAISKNELERQQNLRKKGLASQSDLDQQNQSYLSQQKLVLDMKNQLTLFPDERKVAAAQVKMNQARVQEAQRSLEKTSITLPKDLRISEVDVEQNQVVNMQQTMVVGHGLDVMEVEAQMSLHDMRTLIGSLDTFKGEEHGLPTLKVEAIDASIELNSGNLNVKWPATVARISETVDLNQATVGVILEIQQDYEKIEPDTSPPLINGMFVKAEMLGQQNPSWVVPERALHGDKIYLMNNEDRLTIETVEVLYRRDNQVVIDGDLEQGSKLILNDLLPAINGMLLREVNDSKEEDPA